MGDIDHPSLKPWSQPAVLASACYLRSKTQAKTQDTYVVSTETVRILEHADRTQHFYGMRNFRCVGLRIHCKYVPRTYNLRKKCVCHFLPHVFRKTQQPWSPQKT